jgi:hypothetical protein
MKRRQYHVALYNAVYSGVAINRPAAGLHGGVEADDVGLQAGGAINYFGTRVCTYLNSIMLVKYISQRLVHQQMTFGSRPVVQLTTLALEYANTSVHMVISVVVCCLW